MPYNFKVKIVNFILILLALLICSLCKMQSLKRRRSTSQNAKVEAKPQVFLFLFPLQSPKRIAANWKWNCHVGNPWETQLNQSAKSSTHINKIFSTCNFSSNHSQLLVPAPFKISLCKIRFQIIKHHEFWGHSHHHQGRKGQAQGYQSRLKVSEGRPSVPCWPCCSLSQNWSLRSARRIWISRLPFCCSWISCRWGSFLFNLAIAFCVLLILSSDFKVSL